MKLTQLAGLKFATADIETLDSEITSTVETLLGRKLARADPLRLFLRGIEQIIQQQRLLIDECAKQNLLAYATGDNLDHIGALVGVARLGASPAHTTMRLTLSAPRAQVTIINAGTRFTAGDGVYFALESDVTFPPKVTELSARAVCTAVGVVGNNYLEGELNVIADPSAFLQTATNITKSEGGSELESDDAFRERIHDAPESFSVAGPSGAYRWFAMTASALISDVAVFSPTPGTVEVVPLLDGGELPGEELLEQIEEILNDRRVRPLTDRVIVRAPDIVEYEIDCEYYINRRQAAAAHAIIEAANQAVAEFIVWQKGALGRDINPTELIHRLHAAGVKRVRLRMPDFEELSETQVAYAVKVRADCIGLEDD